MSINKELLRKIVAGNVELGDLRILKCLEEEERKAFVKTMAAFVSTKDEKRLSILHMLNSTIVENADDLVDERDPHFVLRKPEEKIIKDLFYLEAKSCGMHLTTAVSSDIIKNISDWERSCSSKADKLIDDVGDDGARDFISRVLKFEHIPEEILAHYGVLVTSFYNKREAGEREAGKLTVESRISQSINILYSLLLKEEEEGAKQNKDEFFHDKYMPCLIKKAIVDTDRYVNELKIQELKDIKPKPHIMPSDKGIIDKMVDSLFQSYIANLIYGLVMENKYKNAKNDKKINKDEKKYQEKAKEFASELHEKSKVNNQQELKKVITSALKNGHIKISPKNTIDIVATKVIKQFEPGELSSSESCSPLEHMDISTPLGCSEELVGEGLLGEEMMNSDGYARSA